MTFSIKSILLLCETVLKYLLLIYTFLGPPGPPGEPKIVDFDNKSVTLRWGKPKDNGGRPISHYIIQKKDKFGGWFDALITDDDNCVATIEELEARVPGLSEGKWYQFRVIAVNKAGESDPSPHTRPHLCRHKNRKLTVRCLWKICFGIGHGNRDHETSSKRWRLKSFTA